MASVVALCRSARRALALGAAFILAGCGGGEGDAGAYRVAYLPPAGPEAAAARQALDLALAEVNREDAPPPRIELIALDATAEGCESALRGDTVRAIVGHLTGEALARCASAAEAADVPYLSAARTPGEVCSASFHQVAALPNQVAEAAVPVAVEQGARRLHLIGRDDPWSRALLAELRRVAEGAGATVVGTSQLAPDGSGIDAAVRAVASSGAEAVIEAVGDGVVELLKGLHETSQARELRVIATSADEAALRAAATAAEGVFVVSDYFVAVASPESRRFGEALRASNGAQALAPPSAAATYDAIQLVAAAARAAGPDATAAIGATVYGGPRGSIAFPAGGRFARVSIFIGRARADGSVELLTFRPSIEPRTSCG